MRKSQFLTVPATAIGILALSASPALAHNGVDHSAGEMHESTYTAEPSSAWSAMTTLDALNNSGTTGDVMVDVNGNQATVTMEVTGAAETFMDGPFPHAQHIHIGADGVCPPPEADTDGDGAVNVAEGMPFYGDIATSLTTEGDSSADSALAVERFPGGSAYTYERTLTIDDTTSQAIQDGTAVIVVHGVDPTKLSEEAQGKQSELDDSLPLAATLPAACGALNTSQMEAMPEGGADTGVAQQQSSTAETVAIGGGTLALLAAGVYALRRRATRA